MNEAKNTNPKGQSSKRSVSGQRPQKEKLKPSDIQAKYDVDIKPALSLIKKIDDILGEIELKPIKSFEKNEQGKLLHAYEKLIFLMVREINNSRR
ncbi:MAG: hypothetical protein HRU72_10755 [Planctomycetia bacterium]|uniref:Uncharacterized protein n=1 Tax=Candidatus Brocadia sapporoensis TaxID=392547 RepID=A0A1V6LY40_9BACT|nr:hypothetical protein [Candidatus Brocadia sapporoensis]MCC7239524.1 hypothetical protein [Candidatus Brocadia sp.]QOJ06985.1 MAG: hypothetical protein HRU72_10755 [Planctomycetia bacterium]TVL95600.1 MAG: hypothetical protein CV082_10445 [Candidatus Brocadia sp. BL1]MDG6005369.1 hypothetical protein [Candidatus Brocadia sp.]OQD45058.1 hypothetical protein BIY37_10690 [Candidatus Brocadia sapporoensis]